MLVGAILHGAQVQLPRACGHNRIGFGRYDNGGDAALVELAQSQAITAPAPHELHAILRDPYGIIGEHAVEIECDEANRKQQCVERGGCRPRLENSGVGAQAGTTTFDPAGLPPLPPTPTNDSIRTGASTASA